MMGGMGRTFDGGYAEYTCVPAAQVIPFRSEPGLGDLGAVPEMLQTAYGSLTVGLDAQPGQTLLIRGGTSSVGMAAAVLAKDRGLTVLSTTRRPSAPARSRRSASTTPIVDDGEIAEQVRAIVPGRRRRRARARRHADAARHAARDARPRRRLLHRDAEQRVDRARLLPDRLPPRGVRLTAYGGEPPTSRRRPAVLPRRRRRRPPDGADRPHLHPRRDRHRARRHGGRQRHRQARRAGCGSAGS